MGNLAGIVEVTYVCLWFRILPLIVIHAGILTQDNY